jgi:Fe-S-cluster containining protein
LTDFPCTSCGQCCRLIGLHFDHSNPVYQNSPQAVKDLMDNFPHPINSDNSCSMLDENGLCSIYEDRPIICNTKYAPQLLNLTKPQFNNYMAQSCNKLIDDADLDRKFLVQISEVV